TAGTRYLIAVDGWRGASGNISLNWLYALPSPPAAPTNVRAISSRPNQAEITWTAPANTSYPITEYLVTSSPGGRTCTWTTGPLVCNVTGLTAATFADPASLAVGDQVVAVGYALDLDGGASVTSGIISALNRTMQNEDGALNALIQTDAAISSGNSGGPLINMEGHVVGINTAVYRSTDTSAANNIGFAISVGEVKRVIEVLRTEAAGEKRAQGYLGIALSDRTDGGVGAVVSEVASDSPAENAGLKVRDIILQVNDQPITGQGALIGIIRDATPDDEVEIVLERDGERITVKATLVARPSE
ncbi:MAG: hypothetical protein RLZZ93_1397, partial [Actinomycetota bacterium]